MRSAFYKYYLKTNKKKISKNYCTYITHAEHMQEKKTIMAKKW